VFRPGLIVHVDPRGEEALAAAMDRVLEDEDLARELRARSLARAAEFSWEAAARRLLEVMEETWAVRR
jgi:glycosyltransferase involved in cell wall biosynthesis